MPLTVTELIKQGTLNVAARGTTRTHMFLVEGLDPSAANDQLAEAYNADGIPKWGEPHKKIPDLYCASVDPKPFSEDCRTKAYVKATFTVPEFLGIIPTVEIQTAEYQTTWILDRDGKPKIVDYKDPGGIKFKDYAQTRIFRSEIQLTFTRLETGNFAKASDYVEHISSGDFQGKSKEKWRCCAVDAMSQNGGHRYVRKYVFRFRERGWKSDPVLFVNRKNGSIPTDIKVDPSNDGGNGYKRFDDYVTADFNRLKLPNIAALL